MKWRTKLDYEINAVMQEFERQVRRETIKQFDAGINLDARRNVVFQLFDYDYNDHVVRTITLKSLIDIEVDNLKEDNNGFEDEAEAVAAGLERAAKRLRAAAARSRKINQ